MAAAAQSFQVLSCERIDYEIMSSLQKFRFAKFTRAFSGKRGRIPERGTLFSASCNTKNWKENDYHVHFSWYVSQRDFHVSVEYVKGGAKPEAGEKEPFAEDFMHWLGEFFKAGEVSSRVHAIFRYSAKEWRSVLPLPMSVPVVGIERVEVDGMSINLPESPDGLRSALVLKSDDWVIVSLFGSRRVKFRGFDLDAELNTISGVTRTLVMEERR